MTCEIVVANRMGIALAADSAVTYSRADGNQTFSSGANKIFQLASTRPIAAMIYNNASLENIPWELIIKEYRSSLSNSGFDELKNYQSHIIDFLNNNNDLIPDNVRQRSSLSAYYQIINGLITSITSKINETYGETPQEEDASGLWKSEINEIKLSLKNQNIDQCLDQDEIKTEKEMYGEKLANDTKEYVIKTYPNIHSFIDYQDTIGLVIDVAFRGATKISSNYTGLVISGYGDREYLPSYSSIKIYGFIGRKLLWENSGDQAISYGIPSSFIQPFAQSGMVETFTQGASPEVWRTVKDSYLEHAAAVCRQAATEAGVSIPEDVIKKTVNDSTDAFTKGWAFATFNAHLKPLRDVVSGLSVPELAELAETLVMLESLKEKVTSRTQSVGGPIDVAVITRSDGLVWIRRKLHFQPELNQRYLMRLQAQYGAH
uniref:hypothetical protein n=1 Tax=Alcaligenes faecalis TaxID=511 RepID=UPI003CFC037C